MKLFVKGMFKLFQFIFSFLTCGICFGIIIEIPLVIFLAFFGALNLHTLLLTFTLLTTIGGALFVVSEFETY